MVQGHYQFFFVLTDTILCQARLFSCLDLFFKIIIYFLFLCVVKLTTENEFSQKSLRMNLRAQVFGDYLQCLPL